VYAFSSAPEVLSESYVRTGKVWKAADMWSVGVIVFLLVCGYPPFNGDSQEKIFKKIKRGKFRFPKNSDSGGLVLSDSVKHLITELLQMHPQDRLTAEKALEHPWIAGDAAPDAPLPSAVVEALGAFRSKMRLKKAVARVLAHHMTDEDKQHLSQVFNKFDANGDGQLGADEIAAMMKEIKAPGSGNHVQVQQIMDAMDEDGDGGVSMDEFATHVTMGQLGKDKAQIKATFDMFDLDHDGFITHKEIEKVCDFLTPAATQALIKEVDANNDGKINFAEWLAAMQDFDLAKTSGREGAETASATTAEGAKATNSV
jgi:calcium-dependent protein kinase